MTSRKTLAVRLLVFSLLALWVTQGKPGAQSPVSAPVLMWQYGGCLSGPYCQTGWFSSPAVADLEGDGQPDVIWGAYDVVALNGANGGLTWRAPSGNRVWPGVAVADLTGDGTLEVIVGRDSDQLTVYNRFGSAIWTRNPFGSGEIRTMAVADLETDAQLEIIVGQAAGVQNRQLNVFAPNGTVRSGWPARHAGEPGFGGGMWNANLTVADMNGDGFKELFGPTGSHSITALDRNGNQLPASGIYSPRLVWSDVGVHVDHAVDLRGWVNCGVEHRPNFGSSAPVIADVDSDGVPELIVVGNVYNCGTNPYTDLHQLPFIFKLDRTRWSGSGYDWTVIPTAGIGSGPRSQDYQVIENVQPNAVVADLDGDGSMEILFPSYDGRLHAFWLDKAEHGNWPYTIPTSGALGDDFRFASEPIVADLNNDGRAEVIFTSWPKKATGRVGQLHILDHQGGELHRVSLPTPAIGATWNGALGAPTIANIDSDPDLELVVGTVASGVVAYKLPNTVNARVLWRTGRGDYGRTGAPVTETVAPPDTTPPTIAITSPASGGTVRGTVTVAATASDNVGVAGVRFLVDGAAVGTEDTSSPYALAWNTTTATDDSHTLTAVGRDAAGNTTTSPTVTVTVDNAAPTVTMTAPTAGATLSGTITLGATASDNVGVAGVRFRLDGADLGAEDTTAPYSIPWDTRTAANGSHALTAVSRDAAGNTTASPTVTVTVDNAAPTISLSAPAAGATVSGPISVSATASDNAGVAGVRFRLDGADLGAEDTTAPYSVPWDTRTATNGSHTLTAIARDAAGNTATSAAVTVTVSNSTTVTRIEETSSAVTYTGAWIQGNTARPWSGGTAALGFAAGHQAMLTFTGTAVAWIGFRSPQSGIANVYVDGTLVATVDGYAATEAVQAVLFTATGLASGPHTLRIDATGTRNASATDAYVIVDAFDVTGSSTDTGPPQAAITSPTGGATVAGTTQIVATATDDQTVVGVRFFVDGVPIGAEDTTSPYAGSWDTRTLPDGSHTLTATARDAAGNTASSPPVTVTVSNATAPPPPPATRFESTDLSMTYADGTPGPGQPPPWFHGSRSRDWSSGTASFNRSAGARAIFRFTGTSVNWIGFRAYWAGIARVYLDGTLVTQLDLFLPPCTPEQRAQGCIDEDDQAPVFTATGLSPGSHTLVIEVTGGKNPGATDNAVVVDAFDVAPASAPPVEGTRSEETAASVTYSAGWTLGDASAAWSGGTAARSATAGAQTTFTVTGTEVRWIGLRGPDTGIARILLDGSFHAQVDTYFPTIIQGEVFTATGLTPGRHTVTIEVTGSKNAAAMNHQIFVDGFDVRSRFEERDRAVSYAGTWVPEHMDKAWSGTTANTGSGTATYSATAGATATFAFTGTAVSWIGYRGPIAGIADVYVDGALAARIDLYSAVEELRVPVFTATGLSSGPHTVRISVTGQRNPAASNALVVVDAFDVTLPSPGPPVTRVQQTAASVVFTTPPATTGFTQSTPNKLDTGQTVAISTTVGSRAAVTFTGTSVTWIGHRRRDAGIALIYLDGVPVGEVDTFVPTQDEFQAAIFTAANLSPGQHTLTIEVSGRKHGGETCSPGRSPPCSAGTMIVIDAFDIK